MRILKLLEFGQKVLSRAPRLMERLLRLCSKKRSTRVAGASTLAVMPLILWQLCTFIYATFDATEQEKRSNLAMLAMVESVLTVKINKLKLCVDARNLHNELSDFYCEEAVAAYLEPIPGGSHPVRQDLVERRAVEAMLIDVEHERTFVRKRITSDKSQPQTRKMLEAVLFSDLSVIVFILISLVLGCWACIVMQRMSRRCEKNPMGIS